MRYIKTFKENDQNIWYHITTEENYDSIMKDGSLDPKRTVSLGTEDGMWGTIIFKDKSIANNIIRFPTWVIRDTKGYVLLKINIGDDAIGDDGNKSVRNTITGQSRVQVPITTDKIISVTKLPKPDAKVMQIFRKDDLIIGFVNVNFNHSSYGKNKIIIFCRWDDGKDHFDEEHLDQFSDNFKGILDRMMISENDMVKAVRELKDLSFGESEEKIIIPI